MCYCWVLTGTSTYDRMLITASDNRDKNELSFARCDATLNYIITQALANVALLFMRTTA